MTEKMTENIFTKMMLNLQEEKTAKKFGQNVLFLAK